MSDHAYVAHRGDILVPTCDAHASTWRGAPTRHGELATANVTIHNTDMHPDSDDQLDMGENLVTA